MIRDRILQLPKADVHNHLHLGGTAKKLAENYPNTNIIFPKSYNGLSGMIDFIYGDLNKIMLSKKDVICFMKMAIESGIDDNVSKLEASVDIGLVRFFDNSVEQLIDAVIGLKEAYKAQIDFCPDIGINKDLPLEKVYTNGVICITSSAFNGIDIYGKEDNQNLMPFQDLFNTARENNLTTKIHIGEFSDHKSIEDAINILNPSEIQHGIRAVDSKRTMNLILEKNIRLNICPQSNIALGAVKNLLEHPLRKLFDYGINVTVNTDDLLLFDSSLTDQFVDLYNHNVFTYDEIVQISKNAFRK